MSPDVEPNTGPISSQGGDEATARESTPFDTRATELFGIRYPIVQTGMGWVAGSRLTAATSAAGALGVLATATMNYDELVRAIQRVKERTSNPFGVNFNPDLPDLDRRINLTISEGIPVASFAGAPTRDVVAKLHDGGVLCVSTVGARRHAEKVVEFGVDAIIAQGAEGGGHTGAVPTSLLVPQVVDAVGASIPVLAAGGIHDGRGFIAALALGADGIAMGTRFLLTEESRVPTSVKVRYLETGILDTVVTKAIDGRPQRVIRTDLISRLERSSLLSRATGALRSGLAFRKLNEASLGTLANTGITMHRESGLPWNQVLMAANAPMLTKAALVEGRVDAGILPTGQVVGVIESIPTVADLIEHLIEQATMSLERINSMVDR
jgi:NAD(P)H-dependent flavin oxidoreductase YrpB (nitropropane dioxygenase family)